MDEQLGCPLALNFHPFSRRRDIDIAQSEGQFVERLREFIEG
jgi:hypothetical protein